MINLIVACSRYRVIGKDGRLPWKIREDWEYFLEKTKQGILVMGRRCYDEMGKHLLDSLFSQPLDRCERLDHRLAIVANLPDSA